MSDQPPVAAEITAPVLAPANSRTALLAEAGKAWSKTLAGPAISGMVILVIVILAWGAPWGLSWTEATESLRVKFLGSIGVLLALLIGLVYLKLETGIGLSSVDLKVGNLITASAKTDDD